MTTQPHDLKKLREVAEEVVKCAPGCNSNMVRRWYAVANHQTILALLDAYEASARDAERYRELCRQIDDAKPVSNEASTLRNILDDAINLGAGCLDIHLDYAGRHATQGD